jgi:hypothetical protein
VTNASSLVRIVNFKGGFDDPLIKKAVLRCIWTGSSAGSLDPQKEVAAADLKVTCGFSTIERESAELNGSNYRDNIRQQGLEQIEFDEAGLIFPPYRPQRGTFPSPAPAEPKPPPGTPKPKPAPAHGVNGSRVRSRMRGTRPAELASGTSGVFIR